MKNVKRIAILSFVSIFLISCFVTSTYAFGPVTVWSSTSTKSASYARALMLHYSGDNNGKMYATHESWTDNQTPHPAGPNFPIYESTNGGQSWNKISEVADVHPDEGLREQGFLYELPQQIGNMPAGTMLLAVNAFPAGELVHNIELYKSNDLGRNWSYVSTIATGGAYGGGMNWQSQGIWEPFLLAANNKLICYYADEQDPNNNQMVVHRSSSNGIDWSSTKADVALGELRPGMPTVTKMGNGKYMLVYEMVNMQEDQIHYKISSDPENWGNASDPGSKVNYYQGQTPGSQPYVTWVPGGGPNGTVVISGGRSDKLFLNYNYGQGHWTVQDCVIPTGYSRCLVPTGNSTVFIIAAVKNSTTGKSDVKCGTTDILPSNNLYNSNLFMLVNNGTGKTLDLIGGSTSNGSVVNQWTYDANSNNQKWSLVPNGNESFRIASFVSGDDVCVANDSTANEAQIHNWDYTEGNTAHQWNFVDVGNGLFKIINVNSGKCLEVQNGNTSNGAKVQQYDYTGQAWQQWRLQPIGDYYIQARHSGKYINGGGGATSNDTPVIQWSFQTNNWFKWRFESAENGWYKVVYLNAPSKVIDLADVSMEAGHGTHLWDYVSGDNQLVRLVPQQDGSFKIYFKHSGMAWDIEGVSREDSAKLTQYTEANGDNQKFYLERFN
ncbi:Ricin-type beta-trefoil lectin domain-like [Anaerocolumna jejuensis DSM 15929]|uniref:Ricin-type beta-trefoil lectin domain-like n=1 Tax=Anaerocolumna jejuensis DSM 15929 TaxID=1121322 RepID=A0A1M6YPH6_9FIRM|nr:RICIN domain-containing protein [Anaerocolumna jejuensis]SHL20138.1 Ricin-type beta-trefoil lectin domain-like [Anaerocolumna jejuensis DSM 15929]